MVQFFKGSADPRDAALGKLGEALGFTIGDKLNTFYANRSLESVLQDKALEGAPESKKMEAMYNALSPYGKKGQEIFQQRLQIDQQEMQEKETAKQEALQKKKGAAIGKLTKGQELSDEEWQTFSPQEVAALHKAYNPNPAGGATNQPVPAEQINAIENYIKQNPEASADELAIGLGKAGVNPIYSNPYIENRRRKEETNAKNTNEQNKIANKEDILFHQESADFEKSITKNAGVAKKQIPIIENNIKYVKDGKIKPNSLANIFSGLGKTGERISEALLSGEQAALKASVPDFLEGRKELFGVRLSDADLKLLQDKLPDIAKSPEANLAILDLMKRAAERSIDLEKISQDVLEKKGVSRKEGKLRPLGYEREVMKAYDEYEKEEENGVMMLLPDGRQVPINRNNVKDAEALGAKRI